MKLFDRLTADREAADLRKLRATISVGDVVVLEGGRSGLVMNVRVYAHGETEIRLQGCEDLWFPVSSIAGRLA